jgi:hypothetical protein
MSCPVVWWLVTNISNEPTPLKIVAAASCQVLEIYDQTTQCYTPERRYQKLKVI